MPYSSWKDAPQWAQDLGEEKAKQWVAVWNRVFSDTGEEARAFAAASAAVRGKKPTAKALYVPINKLEVDRQMVWGYASTDELDSDGERISLDALRNALPEYMKFANIREMHQPIAAGRTTSAFVDDIGLYLGVHVVDDAAWKKVVNKVYNGFSVGGEVTARDGEWIKGLELVEISLVDRPANPGAVYDVWKMEVHKMGFDLRKYGGAESATDDEVLKLLGEKHVALEKASAERTSAVEKAAVDKTALIEKVGALQKELGEVKATASQALALQEENERLTKAAADRDAKDKAETMKKMLDAAQKAGKFAPEKRPDWEIVFKQAGETVCARMLKDAPVVIPIGKRVGSGGEGEESTTQQCEKIVRQIMTDEKIPYDQAFTKAFSRNQKLFERRDAEQLALSSVRGTMIGGDDSGD